jgi:hypothetical protein
MKLQLLDAWSQPSAREDQLTIVKRELTPEDCAHYDNIGWKYFSDNDLIDRFLPSLGDPIYFSEKHSLSRGVVVEIKGVRYLVQFEELENRRGEESDPAGKSLILTPTDMALSKSDSTSAQGWRGGHYLKFFGQPTWIQSHLYPVDARNNACYHFLTIENGWGDSGNYNILLGLDGDVPVEAYFEASCC